MSITKLPDPLIDLISSFVPPCITETYEELRAENRLVPTFVSPQQHIPILNEAKRLTNQLYTIHQYRCINKQIDKVLVKQQKSLVIKINDLLSKLQDGWMGARCFSECVQTGAYLKVLRVFFFYNPTALFNHATDPERQEICKGTILHSAVNPTWEIPISFVVFVLAMDKQHHLNLTKHKDYSGKTPLRSISNALSHKFIFEGGITQISYKKAKKMLKQHRSNLRWEALSSFSLFSKLLALCGLR